MHYKDIHVEGFEIHRLLSQCLKDGIGLKNIKILNDYQFTARIYGLDWTGFSRITKNKYSVKVLKEKGARHSISKLTANPFTVVGLILFVVIIFLQTTFISEIRIYGYEKLTEREILESLEEVGLFPGGSKYIDLEQIKIDMFRKLENLSWIGIELKGGLALVTIAEGLAAPSDTDMNEDVSCHIVAKKEGYIEKVIAREGVGLVERDDFVNVGEILISGIIGIEDSSYASDSETPNYRYVHSDGEVYAKTVHRFICYQEVHKTEKKALAKALPGLGLRVGNHSFNTADLLVPYELSSYSERKIFSILWPFPIEVTLNKVTPLELKRRVRSQEEIESLANKQARGFIQKNISESAQILNKDLKFLVEENIIKVTILIETLEQIGEKKSFIPRIDRPEV